MVWLQCGSKIFGLVILVELDALGIRTDYFHRRGAKHAEKNPSNAFPGSKSFKTEDDDEDENDFKSF